MTNVGRKARNRPARRSSPDEERAREERACKRKTRYPTQRLVLDARERFRIEHGEDKGIYECEYCGGWHLGGRPL